ncbi:MAG TPA: type II secretion system minor pseudopilin GspJ [Steroidobacteraceae bacterium]|jgi:general secretion pathway protein J|nr:type II secretion system minor pseudopilin GspJ [Steroidobacteraceae bacterium]
MRAARGFTLIELLVALFITAIVATLGYTAINQAVDNRQLVQQRQSRLVAVQATMRLFVQDFAQLAPRPVREPLGEGYQPALSTDSRSGALVTLTRGGWSNPAYVQRATLQRVRYVLQNGRLRREYWTVLDAGLDPPPRSRELLDRVKSVSVRYMDDGRTWRDQWPPPVLTSAPTPRDLRWRPIAVEVTLELEDWGKLVRLIEVAG